MLAEAEKEEAIWESWFQVKYSQSMHKIKWEKTKSRDKA